MDARERDDKDLRELRNRQATPQPGIDFCRERDDTVRLARLTGRQSESRSYRLEEEEMKLALKMFSVAALCVSIAVPASSFAQDHHDDHPADHHDDHPPARGGGYVRHDEWKKGYKMAPGDWARGQRIDYRTYHLSAPPRGYEWRAVDGNYVLAAVATGVVASAIVASTIH